ncbi:hypothetical protein [Gottfriedia solisilvae]|uniref:Uncharacterized protein n=1 Tax=Gottfriedia solisilvae TaxID=1516104 RepID=A0A8J3ANN5_9BACI|nr:hypothetical protein [Gottfriedia solisilvae]GGI18057.1 hypothetical protein GCM10007380_41030 [Gottfriedia solisilvae]
MIHHKKRIVGMFLLCVAIIWYIFYKPTFLMNGNNKKNIVETIQSLNDANQSIEIVKIYDFKKDRYVAYLHDNIPAYIHFEKNTVGNYKFIDADYGYTGLENKTEENLQVFPLFRGYKDGKPLPLNLLVITNYENTVAKLGVRVVNATGSTEKSEINVSTPSASILTMYKASEAFSLEYKYFDKNGKLIK